MRNPLFRDLKTAPRDGTTVEVKHGRDQAVARAQWSGLKQAWLLDDDEDRQLLERVTGWRPINRGKEQDNDGR